VIRFAPSVTSLNRAERYALDLLVDLARLVAVEDPGADVVALDAVDTGDDQPALAALVASRWSLEPGDGVVRIPRSTLRTVTTIAGGVPEQRSAERDARGRVPSSANVLATAGLEHQAVVSRAAALLREAVVAAAGRRAVRLVTPWPGGKRWAAAFTHDLDAVAWWPAFTALRLVELARKGQGTVAFRTVGAAAAAVGRDPIHRAAGDLLERESARGIRSTWFVLCGTPTFATARAGDLTYRPESAAVRRIVAEVTRHGNAIGLHGSFATGTRPGEFEAQRARLERLVGAPVRGVRQHFLRLVPGLTHRQMEAAGFAYDASSAFPDRNGFRLGVADILPVWDEGDGRALGIAEVPLCWMDRALSKYRGVEDPRAWVADALDLAGQCRAANGLWVGLWHPNLVAALGYPGAPAAYDELLRAIMADDPHTDTLDALVEWRRQRRAVRIRRLAPDGRAELAAPAGVDGASILEDPVR
jgi:hypothetical protein